MIEKGQGEKGEYICAFRDKIGSYMMMYIPFGKTITVNTSSIKSKKLNVWWFNPKTGTSKNIGLINNKVSVVLTTPSLGFENDWVLIIDNPKYKYGKPNMKK